MWWLISEFEGTEEEQAEFHEYLLGEPPSHVSMNVHIEADERQLIRQSVNSCVDALRGLSSENDFVAWVDDFERSLNALAAGAEPVSRAASANASSLETAQCAVLGVGKDSARWKPRVDTAHSNGSEQRNRGI